MRVFKHTTKYIFCFYISLLPCFPANNSTDAHHCDIVSIYRTLHQPDTSAVGLNLKDTDNLSPSTPKDSDRTRQPKKNSSRCSIFGINGKIESLSDSDDFGEEVIYSQESPKLEESFKDFDWDLNRFVEYRSLLIKKKKHYQLKNHFRF